MESDSEKSPRARHRFGFSGIRKRSNTPTKVSTDDLLDSLTRQASHQVGFGEEQTKGFDVLIDEEDLGLDSGTRIGPISERRITTTKNIGRFAFVLMLLGGLTVVGLYTSATRLFDLSSVNRFVQSLGVHSVFASPPEIGTIFLVSLAIAFWVAYRRRRLNLNHY